jgi:hypothetical protein
MDDESKQMLRELLDLQKEQTKLLRVFFPQPFRFRFSLRDVLIALTMVAIFLGITAFLNTTAANVKKAAIVPVTKN